MLKKMKGFMEHSWYKGGRIIKTQEGSSGYVPKTGQQKKFWSSKDEFTKGTNPKYLIWMFGSIFKHTNRKKNQH